jgi:N-acetylneuraminic acid mutarotase
MKTKTLILNACGYLLASLLSLAFMTTQLHAQTYEWEWVNGSNTINQGGVYGTAGTAAAANSPGGRYYGSSWLDANGNFWTYGGAAYDKTGANGFLNDLWKYTPSSNEWTWYTGSNTVNASAIYGTEGVAAAGNTPGARYSSTSWADANGNLWLFGGGYGTSTTNVTAFYNDLWKYNIASGKWTWVGGSSNTAGNQTGVYGTKGVAAAANWPGSRFVSVGWIDAVGNLWIFGGVGYDANGKDNFLNDLWKYSPSTGLWTWMSGSNVNSAAAVYGTKGTAAAANVPGARYGAASAIDGNGNFWLFGGGFGPNSNDVTNFYNDLWKYTPSTGQWTWMSGSNTANIAGAYGTQGTASTANYPGGRRGMINWINATSGQIYFLGGLGYAASGGEDYLNDLWTYNIAAGTWTWLTGSKATDANGVYGTMGTPAAANTPGARYSGATAWTDAASNLWLFSGKGYPATGTTVGYMNDIWEFVDVTVLAINWLDFTVTPLGKHTLLQWQTTEEQNNWYFTVQRSADGRNWQNIGTVPGAGSSTATNTYDFTDNQPITGINYYRLKLDDASGEAQYSKVISINFLSTQSQILSWHATGSGSVQAILSNGSTEVFRLFDMSGRLLQQGALQNGQATFSGLAPGLYVCQVKTAAGLLTEKMLVP